MTLPSLSRAGTLILAHFFIYGAAAQDAQSVQGIDLTGLATFTRTVEKTYPITSVAEIFVAHEFGTLRVEAWDEQVVRVSAEIVVGAENAIQAERFAQEIAIAGNHIGDRLEVRTVYPRAEGPSKPGYTANLTISVPRDSTLKLENTFGDIYVRGTRGDVVVDSRFGVVDLSDLSGSVRVRAVGEFPLRATRMANGGTFFLRSTQATFIDISGALHVNNYLGSVELRSPGSTASMAVTSESGPIHLYLAAEGTPHLEAYVDFGSIESEVMLNSETWGESTHGRILNKESTQRFDLYASFDSIFIHRGTREPIAEPLQAGAGEPIKELIEGSYAVAPSVELSVEATVGDVRIEGIDGERVEIVATQRVRLTDVGKARLALEGLAVRVEEEPGILRITTAVQEDMESIGCTAYRVDLLIRCPRSALVRVVAEDGHTWVSDTRASVDVDQAKGTVTINGIAGRAQVSNREGDISAREVTGSVTLHGVGGTVSARDIRGDLDITNDQGRIIIDAPGGAVTARTSGGDVRIIALEGVNGTFDVAAENGNISMAIPDTADAWLILNVHGGTVYSTVPLTGSSERDTHAFQGRLNEGTHRVLLETHEGSILID